MMCPSSGSHRKFEISSSCMYTQTFAQTMTCADERTRGNFRIRLRKHCANTCANAHATAKEMSGCSSRKATREVVDLDVERGAMDDKDLDVGSQIHIPTTRGNTMGFRRHPRTHTAQLLSMQCGASPKPLLAHMRRSIIRLPMAPT